MSNDFKALSEFSCYTLRVLCDLLIHTNTSTDCIKQTLVFIFVISSNRNDICVSLPIINTILFMIKSQKHRNTKQINLKWSSQSSISNQIRTMFKLPSQDID